MDDGVAYGLHGRISNTPAEVTAAKGEWVGDRYRMLFEGTVRESMALGPRLVLRRRIVSWLDEAEISVEDTITNESWYDAPLLTSYHINFGYPFITEDAVVRFKNRVRSEFSTTHPKRAAWRTSTGCDRPTKDFAEQIYLQELEPENGMRSFQVRNTVNGAPLAVEVSFSGKPEPAHPLAAVRRRRLCARLRAGQYDHQWARQGARRRECFHARRAGIRALRTDIPVFLKRNAINNFTGRIHMRPAFIYANADGAPGHAQRAEEGDKTPCRAVSAVMVRRREGGRVYKPALCCPLRARGRKQ